MEPASETASADGTLDRLRQSLKDQFVAERGYWSHVWDGLLDLDPEFFRRHLEISAYPWRHGQLSPKVRELCYIAMDASVTHLYAPGLRAHISNALNHGATPQEILEVLELTSAIGIHACNLGVPLLLEELDRRGIDRREAVAENAPPLPEAAA